LAKKTNKKNIRKQQGGPKRPLAVLLAIVLLIVAVFLGLEWLKTARLPLVEEKTVTVERRQIPPRPEHKEYEQRPYTSVPPPAAHLPKKAGRRPSGPGSLAIIIDDMGAGMQEARELLAIGLPITFSVIPGLPKDRAVAELAHQQGGRVMIHLPMEPQGYPERRLEKNGLLLSQSEAEITERLRTYFQAVPHAVGANNHMGSRFTEDREKMGLVLNILKGKGLFFIDSLTSPKSVGLQLAHQLGMEAGTRNVFLDNVQEVGLIKVQLEEAARIARRKGGAIAIGHPHPATIRALREMMPELRDAGIRFVYASELVR
jgi:polysaccharide deacetylase 2 family uncharacterized protein YibQ